MATGDLKLVLKVDTGGLMLELLAAQFGTEALVARHQMLGSASDEQRSFWAGVYHAHTKTAEALRGLAQEHKEISDDTATNAT